MKLAAIGNALHRLYRLTLYFRCQHQTGTHQTIIHQYGASAAVTGIAANLGANQLELIAEHLSQHLTGRAKKRRALAVNGGLHGHFIERLVHERASVIRACALAIARDTNTPTTWVRYSAVPRLSDMGVAAARTAATAASIAA